MLTPRAQNRVIRASLLLAVLILAACGAGPRPHAVSRDGRSVLRDAYDGRFDHDWTCGSLRAAVHRLPVDGPVHSTLPRTIDDAAAKACDDALDRIHAGSTSAQVAAALGAPETHGRCRLYRWPPAAGSVDGARICFAAGRVTRVLIAVHG